MTAAQRAARRIAAIVAPPRECPICVDEQRRPRTARASHGYCPRHQPHPVKVAGRWIVTYGGAP